MTIETAWLGANDIDITRSPRDKAVTPNRHRASIVGIIIDNQHPATQLLLALYTSLDHLVHGSRYCFPFVRQISSLHFRQLVAVAKSIHLGGSDAVSFSGSASEGSLRDWGDR